jgi:RNA polymerase sigma-70 factor (ECF subfamily)
MGQRDRFDGQFDAVLAAAQAGAPWALERMFMALAPAVAGYLRVQGSAEPEDLTSEVFIGVLRGLDDFRGDEPGFRSWVFTIAHRRLLDERRRRVRRPPPEGLADTGGAPAHEAPAPEDVEAAVDESLGRERVRGLCERLVSDQRDVLLLRLVADLSIEQIATMLGKSTGAVKALQRRGLTAVGRLLEREGVPL